MSGFFTIKQTESKSRPDGKTHSCASCGLYKDAKSPKMAPFGEFKKEILNIGEAPGKTEDERNKPWQGKSGLLLKKVYRRLGIDLFEDCLNINACLCRPMNKGDNRPPTNLEIDCCRKSLLKVIEDYQPKVIVLLGGSALYAVLGNRWKRSLEGITKWRGFTIPDKELKAWICPTFHPSFVERSEGEEIETIWTQDLQQAFLKVEEPLPKFKKPKITVIEDLSVLNDIKSNLIAFDYETTGIKPHAPGHRIVCASVAVSENECFVFMMPKSKKATQPFIDLLANLHIGKMAHNMKFEEIWSAVRLRQPVANWEWDSMVAAHILDNRPGVTSLKFQTYVNFGIIDYESEVSPYLKSASKDGNALNKIQELVKTPKGRELLLEYCALDSVYEYRLAMKQIQIMNYTFLPF